MFDCEFLEGATNTFDFERGVLLATAADNFNFLYNTYTTADAQGTSVNVIDADTGVVNGLTIVGNKIIGEFTEGAIHSTQACLECFIKDNSITNLTSGQHAIEFTSTATGFAIGNRLQTDARATAFDSGALSCHDNTWLDTDSSNYEEAVHFNAQLNSPTKPAEKSGSYLLVTSTVTSSSIPNNTQTAGAITGASSGTLLLINIYINTDGTGLAGPTNMEFSVDNAAGVTGPAAPFITEAIAGLGVDISWDAQADSTTNFLPLQLESGKKVFIHGDNGVGTSGGVAEVTMVFQRITDGATITGNDGPS